VPYLTTSGRELYYETHGEGPWLVFAHGAGGNHLSWWQQVPVFATRYRCVVFDQRGWGRSTGAPDPAAFSADLSDLLDHLGAQQAVLVGQSMGGWTALGYAVANPSRVARLIVTGTLAGLTDDDMIAQLISRHSGQQGFDPHRALAPDFPAREPVRTFLYDEIASLNPPVTQEFLAALISLRYSGDVARLSMPLCFIAGDCDQLFPLDLVRAAHAKVPHAELHVVTGAGHSIYFEAPDVFNRLLDAFLRAA
jgi:3-oxoadipate enol-lactonase